MRSSTLGQDTDVGAGRAQPLGATPGVAGVNFSVYAENAEAVSLLLFESELSGQPYRTVRLDPQTHRSFHFWHCHVAGLRPGQVYAYRVDGPDATADNGFRFDHDKVLLDPYTRAVSHAVWDRGAAVTPGDNVETSLRAIVFDTGGYDWEDDTPPDIPLHDSVLYELHVRGFTRHSSAGVLAPGTFAGVVEKIPYLADLGVTAVELMPVFDFDDTEVLGTDPTGRPLHNYWGYDPLTFFALHPRYCHATTAPDQLTEFRDMVKALHRASIEVVLDVVFNHTSERNEQGPTIGLRGLANESYYHLAHSDRRYYMNYTGCGNAINANHPVVAKLIIEALEYWVTECHVDGFRFDLASELSRGPDGAELADPPVLWGIELSSVLDHVKIIAEPWDADGIYQLGRFPGKRWSEWNGRYRDEVRDFVRGRPGVVGAVAARIAGSADLYDAPGELPTTSVNYITSHDGFTLADMVSHDRRHNEANGADNLDGTADNRSWNCGVEGPTAERDVLRLRDRQVRNFATILLLSRGVPMLLGGDEFGRTQRGNNNAYCHDDETTWFDWSLLERHADRHRFFQEMLALRARFPVLRRPRFYRGPDSGVLGESITWHGTRLDTPDWTDPQARALAFTVEDATDRAVIHVMLNMFDEALEFELPEAVGRNPVLLVETARASPEDISRNGVPRTPGTTHLVADHSCVVLISGGTGR